MDKPPPLGFRWWRIGESKERPGELALWSPSMTWEWPVGTVAKSTHIYYDEFDIYQGSNCNKGDLCEECGLYFFLSMKQLWERTAKYLAISRPTLWVNTVTEDVGRIKYHGKVAVPGAAIGGGKLHRHGMEGFRTQQCLPVAFATKGNPHPWVVSYSKMAGIPILPFENFERLTQEWVEWCQPLVWEEAPEGKGPEWESEVVLPNQPWTGIPLD